MPDNTSFDPKHDNTTSVEPKLDLRQLQNKSASDLIVEPDFDDDEGTYQQIILNDDRNIPNNEIAENDNSLDDTDLCNNSDGGEGGINLTSLSDTHGDDLDLTSLKDAEKSTGSANGSIESIDAEALYNDTIALMKSGKTDIETGVALLRRSAEAGNAMAWLYLGQIYSNKSCAIYNPTLAYDSYLHAAEQNFAAGHYNQALCLSSGFGCLKDYGAALKCFSRGAELFDPDCIFAVAMCYEFGIGCEINYEYAFNLYEKGAELGHAGCTNNLGGCYFYGHGIEQSKECALEIFKKAAECGSANAKCRLGLCYMNGDGCAQDNSLAFEYIKDAASQQNAIAIFNLAKCYDNGIGTEQNFRSAYKCYTRAAGLGHAEAKYEAGKMIMQGRGTKKDPYSACRMFSSAARHGYAPAEYEVANCYLEGAGAVRNRTAAYNHYISAYELGGENQANAAYRLGLCTLKGLGTKQDKAKAVEWFKAGCELGSPEAMYMLGECHYYGIGVEQDYDRAFVLYTRAAQKVSGLSIPIKCHAHLFIAIAQCYENGIGAQADPQKAIVAYKCAAEHCDSEALYRAGNAVLSGLGMSADIPAARTYFLRAARHGYMPAMLMMGSYSERGRMGQKNISDAKNWYVKAVTLKNDPKISLYEFPERFAEAMMLYSEAKKEAQYRLGMMMARDEASTQDRIKAFEYIATSAAMGYAPARKEITKIHLSGGDLKAYYESPFSDEEAPFEDGHSSPSARDLAIAMHKLGDAFFDGKGLLKKNDAASINCYKVAAELGMVDACYSYGWCLRHGFGADENDAEAVKWLKLAADKGNSGAAYSYGLCCEEGSGTGVKNKREAMYYYRIAAAAGHTEAAKRYVMLSNHNE